MELKHPASPDAEPFIVSEKAYEQTWKERGWVPAKQVSSPEPPAEPAEPAKKPEAATQPKPR